MSEKLNQANRILDRTCKKAGLDPVEVRVAMIQTLQAKLANGKGFERLPPTDEAAMHRMTAKSWAAETQEAE